MHDDFLVPDITAKTLEYVHITEKEKDIAEDLLQKGYMVKKECRNLEKIKLQSFYELDIPRGVNTIDSGSRCKKYQLSNVGGSNAFLGKKHTLHGLSVLLIEVTINDIFQYFNQNTVIVYVKGLAFPRAKRVW